MAKKVKKNPRMPRRRMPAPSTTFTDRKKEESSKKCRGKVEDDENI